MHHTARAVSKVYLVAVVWFVVMVAMAMALLGPMGTLYSAIDAAPQVRAFGNLAIAIMVATAVAGLIWSRLGARALATREDPHMVADPADSDREAALVPITR